MSTIEESLPRIKGKEALDLITKALLEEGVDRKVTISMILLVNNSLKRKITICHDSLFEQRLREICKENKHEMNRGNCRKVANEILDLFYDDPDERIWAFLKNYRDLISIVISIISLELTIILFLINYFFK